MNLSAPFPTSSRTSRRTFLQSTAAVSLATPWLTSNPAAAATRDTPANSRIQIGLIGCGGMGRANLDACAAYPDVVVTAACDVWKSRRDAVTDRFPKTCQPFADYRDVLRSSNVDAVIIATPPHWHALMAIEACAAGKDLYLQKPMTLHLGESLAVRNAVRRHQRMCQVGTQIHASQNYRRVVEFLRAGLLGPVGVARTFNVMNQGPEGIGHAGATAAPNDLDWDFWCGPAPRRPFHPLLVQDAYHHCSWMDYSGGWTPGMAPHLIDLPIWALDLGFPEVTSSSGGRFVVQDDGDAYDHHEVLWRYPRLTLAWMSSITNSFDFLSRENAPSSRRLGVFFQGTNGTMVADYDRFRILAEGNRMKDRSAPPPSLPPSPGHEREWLDSIQSRRPPSCSPDYHVKVDVPIALSLLSLKLGRSIRFDAATEQIVGDPEATRLAVPTYRDPWRFPAEYL
jgi:predicted dehydrogenase